MKSSTGFSVAAIRLLFVLSATTCLASKVLEQVDDTDLMHLLTGEDNVVALFTKSNCPECDELETVMDNVVKELQESLGAVVVKAHNSQLLSIYNPSREASLIYFRRGIPLLYHGDFKEDEILHTFTNNKEPVVKELSDGNFEHLTQAATGATTGDWFIFFYSADCVLCQRLYAVWEAVGSKLKHRLNVARVNRVEAGRSTAKRFGIVESPEFILLRLGKVYRYRIKDYTPQKFIEFAENGFRRQTSPEEVPPVHSLMDDVYSNFLVTLSQNSQLVVAAAVIFMTLVTLVMVIRKCFGQKPKKATQKSKKSK